MINRPVDQYNNETVVCVESEDQRTLPDFFKKRRKKLQRKIQQKAGTSFAEYYPLDNIVALLNISKDLLRKKLNGQKPLTRDWLIAICAAHGLNSSDTDEALVIAKMPRLDDGERKGEIIVDFLNEHEYRPVAIIDLNRILANAGLPELDTGDKNSAHLKDIEGTVVFPYSEIGKKVVRAFQFEGDPYNSVSTKYLPDSRCIAEGLLEDAQSNKFHLEAYSDGKYVVSTAGEFPQMYDSLEETGLFRTYFAKLAELARREKQRLDKVANDSRNYRQGRFGANLKNDAIHCFFEEFNYSMPERQEFYLMEYVDGHYVLSVSQQSMFMQEYLSEEDFFKHYHSRKRVSRQTFDSIDEIIKLKNDPRQAHFYSGLYRARELAFKRLSAAVEEFLNRIRDRSIYINNLSYIWDNPLEVLRYYGITEEFECECDEDGEIHTTKSEAQFDDGYGNFTTLTLSEIERAFELGFLDIKQICRVKCRGGCIDSVLK